MLIWIRVPCAAFGVLATFVLLLSTIASEQVESNLTSGNLEVTTAPTSENRDPKDLMLMSLPFAHELSNPCGWKRQPSYITPEENRATFIREFYTVVSRYASLSTEDNLEMLTNHTIGNCRRLHVDNLPHTPTLEELEGMNVDEALNKIYLSLLVHSAYSFFIHHQFTSNDLKCSGNVEGEQSFANKSLLLAHKQKTLACYVRVGMSVLEYEQDDVLPLLNDTISDLSLCSRRAIRDCQVMKSTHNFLDMVSLYTSRKIQEFTTTTAPQVTTPNR